MTCDADGLAVAWHIEKLKAFRRSGVRLRPSDDLCRADRDGECGWVVCPQKREYRVWCPLALTNDEWEAMAE